MTSASVVLASRASPNPVEHSEGKQIRMCNLIRNIGPLGESSPNYRPTKVLKHVGGSLSWNISSVYGLSCSNSEIGKDLSRKEASLCHKPFPKGKGRLLNNLAKKRIDCPSQASKSIMNNTSAKRARCNDRVDKTPGQNLKWYFFEVGPVDSRVPGLRRVAW